MPRIKCSALQCLLPAAFVVFWLSMPIARGAQDVALLEEQAMKAALDRVAPSVVRIETVGGADRLGEMLVGTGPTTGLIVSEDGYIVSSAFNFAQKPDSILVTLPGGRRTAAKIVATDHSRMLVLLKVNTDARLPLPKSVPPGEMRVGQWALAVGRTFDPEHPNLSVGIVSALERIWGRALQTDAKISPSNYGGPLIDISGRVLGVLVPLTPDAGSESAGVDWYDSGIGFAVPLAHVEKVLPRLKSGQDLYPGILGINLKGADVFSLPAEIAACRVTSPAYKAGLRAGDTIVAIEGQPVSRQAQLKHQLNHRYAGDKVALVAMRGKEKLERTVELVAKLEPYEYPFLGILPLRGNTEGLLVRYVYPDSPADKAKLEAGDRIETFQGAKIKDAAALAEKLRQLGPGESAKLELRRGDKLLPVEVALGRLPESVPADLPAAHAAVQRAEGERPKTGVVKLKVPEFENECWSYVPEAYDPALPYGIVVWLHAPGGFKAEELLERWKEHCDRRDLILIAPKSADVAKWQPTEVKFVRRVLDELLESYNVDRGRIVVHGHEGGGALAYLAAFTNQDLIRAVAPVDAPLPPMAKPPENDPVHRLAFYIFTAKKATLSTLIGSGIQLLKEMKYPVVVKSVGDQPRYLTAGELDDLARWIDTLDRL